METEVFLMMLQKNEWMMPFVKQTIVVKKKIRRSMTEAIYYRDHYKSSSDGEESSKWSGDDTGWGFNR